MISTVRRHATTVYAVALCLSVSVTCWYYAKWLNVRGYANNSKQ